MSVATSIGTAGAEAVIVKLAPIPGWKVTPEEYRLTANNEHADFTLEKVPAISRKSYWPIAIYVFGAVIVVALGLVFVWRGKGKKDTAIGR